MRWIIVWIAGALLLAGGPASAQTCTLGQRIPFAGHTLPLDADLTSDTYAAVDPFPSMSNAALDQPVYMTHAGDGTNRLFTLRQNGFVDVFPNSPTIDDTDVTVFLDISALVDVSFVEEGLLGLAFHPDYANNGYFYVYYTADPTTCAQYARCARIVRYSVDASDADLADPGSASLVLEIDRPGSGEEHNGGMLAFGSDGYLYVSMGDGGVRAEAPNPNSLRGKILRIDVDSGTPGSPGIPPGNPFANEVLHVGLRNPWRFSFDRESPGDLWIGDVGEMAWEEVDFVRPSEGTGLDFGWPGCEGTHPFDDPVCDPAHRFPDIEYGHQGSLRSVTGGYVYRGSVTSLIGYYVFADLNGDVFRWDTATRDPGTGLGVTELIIGNTGDRIVSFAEDEAGELYGIYLTGDRIRRIEVGSSGSGDPFPELLSQTGFFSDVVALTPAAGLVEYDVASPLWSDDAIKKRWLALPGTEVITFEADGGWSFPIGTAIVKHFELDTGSGIERLETRVMLRQTTRWLGMTYQWNAGGTDAQLLRDEVTEVIPVSGGSQTWTYPSPGGCLFCHGSAGGRILGVRTRQLNSDFAYPGGVENQLEAWNCIGLFDTDIGDPDQFERHVGLSDGSTSRQHRVRSHFASNCAHCHQPGTGVANIDLRPTVLLGEMNAIGIAPSRGDLGLPTPEIIEAGDHGNSVLWLRMNSTDETVRMAAGTRLQHVAAIDEVKDWIDLDLFDAQAQTPVLDSDEDAVEDASDNCASVANGGQSDVDMDGVGDACDVDLFADLRAVPNSLPQVVLFGQALSLSATVFNDGLSYAEASQVRFHLSSDVMLDPGDTLMGDCFVALTGAGSSASCTDSAVVVPTDFGATGSHYWLACADGMSLVPEVTESNNCASSPVQVYSEAIPHLPSMPRVGYTLTVSLLLLAGAVALVRRFALRNRVG